MRCALSILLLLACARAYADDEVEFRLHRDTGLHFLGVGEPERALSELTLADALRPSDALACPIARAHQLAGHSALAAAFYRRCVESDAPSDEREHAQLALEPHIDMVRFDARHARGRKLVGFGIALLGAAWVTSLPPASYFGIEGAEIDPHHRWQAATVLPIPVAGPFASGFIDREPAWSLPLIFVLGPAQIAGVVLFAIGAHDLRRPRSGR